MLANRSSFQTFFQVTSSQKKIQAGESHGPNSAL